VAWVRVDDGLPTNRKYGLLTVSEQAGLIAIWCFLAKSGGDGTFTLDELPRINYHAGGKTYSVTAAQVKRYAELALVDPLDDGNGFVIHDWDDYQPKDPTAADRMRQYRKRLKERDSDTRNEP